MTETYAKADRTPDGLALLEAYAKKLSGWRVWECLGPFAAEKTTREGTHIELHNYDAHALIRAMWGVEAAFPESIDGGLTTY